MKAENPTSVAFVSGLITKLDESKETHYNKDDIRTEWVQREMTLIFLGDIRSRKVPSIVSFWPVECDYVSLCVLQ